MNRKRIAKPIATIFWIKEDGSRRELGVLFRWNTGETELRWTISPQVFGSGMICRGAL